MTAASFAAPAPDQGHSGTVARSQTGQITISQNMTVNDDLRQDDLTMTQHPLAPRGDVPTA